MLGAYFLLSVLFVCLLVISLLDPSFICVGERWCLLHTSILADLLGLQAHRFVGQRQISLKWVTQDLSNPREEEVERILFQATLPVHDDYTCLSWKELLSLTDIHYKVNSFLVINNVCVYENVILPRYGVARSSQWANEGGGDDDKDN